MCSEWFVVCTESTWENQSEEIISELCYLESIFFSSPWIWNAVLNNRFIEHERWIVWCYYPFGFGVCVQLSMCVCVRVLIIAKYLRLEFLNWQCPSEECPATLGLLAVFQLLVSGCLTWILLIGLMNRFNPSIPDFGTCLQKHCCFRKQGSLVQCTCSVWPTDHQTRLSLYCTFCNLHTVPTVESSCVDIVQEIHVHFQEMKCIWKSQLGIKVTLKCCKVTVPSFPHACKQIRISPYESTAPYHVCKPNGKCCMNNLQHYHALFLTQANEWP